MSWKNKDIRHQPLYENREELDTILKEIKSVPGIVEIERINDLKQKLCECGQGKRIIVHLGDCSETFKDCNEESIKSRYALYTLCQVLMQKMLGLEVTKIGRIAGQYAKPRSSSVEETNGEVINSFFGDNVNQFEATKEGRKPDPKRLLQGYHWAVTTYHYLRMIEEEYDLYDTISHILEEKLRDISTIDKESEDYVKFINTLKDSLEDEKDIEDTYISHEGLILDYESNLTRQIDFQDMKKTVRYIV